jgi:WD40 repeat protein
LRGSAVVLNHHARNTVFSCLDFEFSARAVTRLGNADNSLENDSLKRVYVASKHGMVFQINYQTEALEATYQTNDSAIYSIAVNEAFCVTGSEDNFVRVWPLDFSEFYLEAKHENTVCAVDISADGLRIICGTMYGSIGLLDKSNQNYKTLVRCHTDDIVCMEYHLAYRSIITVSKDKTIRLWNIDNFDQNVEFTCPID